MNHDSYTKVKIKELLPFVFCIKDAVEDYHAEQMEKFLEKALEMRGKSQWWFIFNFKNSKIRQFRKMTDDEVKDNIRSIWYWSGEDTWYNPPWEKHFSGFKEVEKIRNQIVNGSTDGEIALSTHHSSKIYKLYDTLKEKGWIEDEA